MWNFVVLLSLALSTGMAGVVQAADIEAGKRKADAACAFCHGPDGISNEPQYPSLAGRRLLTSWRS